MRKIAIIILLIGILAISVSALARTEIYTFHPFLYIDYEDRVIKKATLKYKGEIESVKARSFEIDKEKKVAEKPAVWQEANWRVEIKPSAIQLYPKGRISKGSVLVVVIETDDKHFDLTLGWDGPQFDTMALEMMIRQWRRKCY